MPRRSSEDLAASLWRSQAEQPVLQPPAHLKGVARQVYTEIVGFYALGEVLAAISAP